MSASLGEAPQIVEELKGFMTDVRPDRIGIQHLELRDRALRKMDQALEAVRELAQLERGEASQGSPRYTSVRGVQGDLGHLRDKLDRTYV